MSYTVKSKLIIQKIKEYGEKYMSIHDDKSVKILTDFVEGKITIQDFKHEWDNNDSIKETLQNDSLFYVKAADYINYRMGTDQKNIILFLATMNWSARIDQLYIWGEITRFLTRYNYTFTPTKYYEDRVDFLLDILPSWLDIQDEDFLMHEIINTIPQELKSKEQKVKWCKNKFKNLFKYETMPPKWVKCPEWPFSNGKPLIFKRQTKLAANDELIIFYFYDPDTLQEHIVVQRF